MDIVQAFISANVAWIAAGALALAALVLFVRAARLKSQVKRAKAAADEVSKRGEERIESLRTRLLALKSKGRASVTQNDNLPTLVRELTADLNRRRFAPHLVTVLRQFFRSEQAFTYYADAERRYLRLVAVDGVHEGASSLGSRIPIGQGRIGLVAEKGICMSDEDFRHESNVNRRRIQCDEERGHPVDLAAPLVSDGVLLGAIGVTLRNRATDKEKRLFAMVADVAALALSTKIQAQRIQVLGHSDTMTRISNKAHLMSRGTELLEEAGESGRPAAVVMLDVDFFKKFNDTQGHLAGDRVLCGVARCLRRYVRDADIAARFGGEEFVVFLNDTDRDTAIHIANRIRAAVEENDFGGLVPAGTKRLTISGGVAAFPGDGRTMEELLEYADQELYRAKDAGRNQIFPLREVDRFSLDERDQDAAVPLTCNTDIFSTSELSDEARARLDRFHDEEDAIAEMEESGEFEIESV